MLDELHALAQRYGGALPEDYINAITSFEAVAAEYGLTEEEREDLAYWDFPRVPERVAELNDVIRAASAEWGSEYEPWPDGLFVIGENGLGDYYFVDLTGKHLGVGYWDHEVGQVRYYDPNAEHEEATSPLSYSRAGIDLFPSAADYLHARAASMAERRNPDNLSG